MRLDLSPLNSSTTRTVGHRPCRASGCVNAPGSGRKSKPWSCRGLQNTPPPYWAGSGLHMWPCSFWLVSCRELQTSPYWAFLESLRSPCVASLPSVLPPPPLHLHPPPLQSQRATARCHCLTGGSVLPTAERFSSHVRSDRGYLTTGTCRQSSSNSLDILFLSLWGVVETNWTFFLCRAEQREQRWCWELI